MCVLSFLKAIQSISQKLYEECVRLDKTGLNLLNKNMFLMINKAIKEMSDCKEIKKKQLKELNKLKTRKSNPIPPETRGKSNCFKIEFSYTI